MYNLLPIGKLHVNCCNDFKVSNKLKFFQPMIKATHKDIIKVHITHKSLLSDSHFPSRPYIGHDCVKAGGFPSHVKNMKLVKLAYLIKIGAVNELETLRCAVHGTVHRHL